uniref:ANK_REP_REGION domain-containing protein n=1 Tax=Heterorhabditis bacteriophora TaxID=37862 RepID=A0A1I7WMA5_HETBA
MSYNFKIPDSFRKRKVEGGSDKNSEGSFAPQRSQVAQSRLFGNLIRGGAPWTITARDPSCEGLDSNSYELNSSSSVSTKKNESSSGFSRYLKKSRGVLSTRATEDGSTVAMNNYKLIRKTIPKEKISRNERTSVSFRGLVNSTQPEDAQTQRLLLSRKSPQSIASAAAVKRAAKVVRCRLSTTNDQEQNNKPKVSTISRPKQLTISSMNPTIELNSSDLNREQILILKSLSCLQGRHCPTEYDRYQVLDERDKLLCRWRDEKDKLDFPINQGKSRVVEGECRGMCPEKERYVRVVQKRISSYECGPEGIMEPQRMVKEYARSAADQEKPLPHELRTKKMLKESMDYLLKHVRNLLLILLLLGLLVILDQKAVRDSRPVRLAIQLSSALQNKNYVRFFRILKNDATFLQCCICHRYFDRVRSGALSVMISSFGRNSAFPLDKIWKVLAWDDRHDALRSLSVYGIRQNDMDHDQIVLNRELFSSDELPGLRSYDWIDAKNRVSLSQVFNFFVYNNIVNSTFLSQKCGSKVLYLDIHFCYILVSTNNLLFSRSVTKEIIGDEVNELKRKLAEEETERLGEHTRLQAQLLTDGVISDVIHTLTLDLIGEEMRAAMVSYIDETSKLIFERLWLNKLQAVVDKETKLVIRKTLKADAQEVCTFLFPLSCRSNNFICTGIKIQVDDGLTRFRERMSLLWLRQFWDAWRANVEANRRSREERRIAWEMFKPNWNCKLFSPLLYVSKCDSGKRLPLGKNMMLQSSEIRHNLKISELKHRRKIRIIQAAVNHWKDYVRRRAVGNLLSKQFLRSEGLPFLAATKVSNPTGTFKCRINNRRRSNPLISSFLPSSPSPKHRRLNSGYSFLHPDDSFLGNGCLSVSTPIISESQRMNNQIILLMRVNNII